MMRLCSELGVRVRMWSRGFRLGDAGERGVEIGKSWFGEPE